MDLEIVEVKRSGFRNCYELIINFMFNDADRYEDVRFYISDEQYNDLDFRARLFDFIKHIQSCITLDTCERGGFDAGSDACEWYGVRIANFYPAYNWNKYCRDSFHNVDTRNLADFDESFAYDIPREPDGWYASYESLEIVHYDNSGDISRVKIIENDN